MCAIGSRRCAGGSKTIERVAAFGVVPLLTRASPRISGSPRATSPANAAPPSGSRFHARAPQLKRHDMLDINEIVARYVAVWNEADAEERRRRIRAIWVPDGTTCYRLLDAQGYEAIEARVTGSWDKWLSEGKYIFRPQNAVC